MYVNFDQNYQDKRKILHHPSLHLNLCEGKQLLKNNHKNKSYHKIINHFISEKKVCHKKEKKKKGLFKKIEKDLSL